MCAWEKHAASCGRRARGDSATGLRGGARAPALYSKRGGRAAVQPPSKPAQSSGRHVAVVGTGYVGLVTGACLASLGHRVYCIDVDEAKVQKLQSGGVPFYEPGLEAVVADAVAAGNLSFSTDGAQLAKADVAFLAVPTPPAGDGSADLSFVEDATSTAAQHLPRDAVLVTRSTVPPGTGDRLENQLAGEGRGDIQVVSAPEFLAEGTAVRDFLQPERLVFGGAPDAANRVAGLFDDLPDAPRIVTNRRTAELTKYAANTFLAARVSLINELANLCDDLGADVTTLARAVGLDSRIGGKFLRAGIGYGGSCFPKDVPALAAVGRSVGLRLPVVEATHETNQTQWQIVLKRCRDWVGDLQGITAAVLGVAFKPETDDTREAPGLKLMQALVDAGATVRAHDPLARLPAQMASTVSQVDSVAAAVNGADLVILVTEWAAYRDEPWAEHSRAMRHARLLDARNHLDLPALRAAGFDARGVGTR